MKKLFLLCVISVTVMACPNDDDNNPVDPQQDQIIGTWKYFKYFENDIEQPLESCESETTLVFDEDGTFSIDNFEEINGNCEPEGQQNATWTNPSGSNYTFMIDGETETAEITFENNTFYTELFDDNGTPGDTTDDIVEKDVFIKQ